MQDVSPEVAAGGFIGVVLGLIRLATYAIQVVNARRLRALQSIPPSATTRGPDLERRVAALERSELDDLRVRLAVLEAEVEDARLIARDYARTAAALAAERERADRAERMARVMRDELDRILREIEGGHTRLATMRTDANTARPPSRILPPIRR